MLCSAARVSPDMTPDVDGTLSESPDVGALARLIPRRDELEAGRVFASLHERMFGSADRVTIGRFEVIGRLGAGAMGVVYAARDPRLDRDVALKVLRGEHRAGEAAARLLREAKALARLRHPHVVTILEIGTHDDGLFIAMDRVEGQTLRAWLRDAPPWPRIVDVFVQAGRGLAAAHAADLVHRDFKPDNVLVDQQGQAKVVDFGLARDGGLAGISHERSLEDTEPGDLTRTGALVGTPAYMAPEAFRGDSDARSDQFSFCASLYEALYGVRPFTGPTGLLLLEAIERGQLEKPLVGHSAPKWLRRIVVRGLAADPAHRFESMEALLTAIEERQRRRSAFMIGGTGLGGLVLGGLAVSASALGQGDDRCKHAALAMNDVWSDSQRASTRQAFVTTGVGYADETWHRVERTLDGYAQAWAAMRISSCTATQRGEQSDSLHDLRMTCLDRRLHAVRSMLELFAEADRDLVARAVETVRGLPQLEPCTDEHALRETERRGPGLELQAQAELLHERLATVHVRKHAGQYGAALVEAEAIARQADDDALHDVAALAHLLVAQLQDKLEDFESAAQAAKHAVLAADAAGDDQVRARAVTWLVSIEGKQHAISAGHEWVRMGQALLARLDQPIALRASLAEHEAMLLHHAGHFEDSVRRHREALDLQSQYLAADDLQLAATHHNLASTLGELSRLDEALDSLERVLEIRIAALGERHPSVARAMNSIASMLTDQGRFAEATEHLEKAIDIGTESLGPDHPFVGDALIHLGNVIAQGPEPMASLPHYERGIAVLESSKGAEDIRVAYALGNYGRVLWGTGQLQEAQQVLERSLRIQEKVTGPEHVNLMYVLNTLSQTMLGLERHAQAREAAERGLAVAVAGLGEDHPMVAQLLLTLAQIHRESDQPELAIDPLERALAIHERTNVRRAERGPVAFGLAEVLWNAGETARAIALAQSALEDLRTESEVQDVWIREVSLWLRERNELERGR
jgi:eukaryotic-like serine/threonine-protein kinase